MGHITSRGRFIFVGLIWLTMWFLTKTVGSSDFENRCQSAGIVRCFGFDSQVETDIHVLPPVGQSRKRAQVVTEVKSSGRGSLRFEIPSNSAADTSGSFWLNFSQDLQSQFGEGDEFYVQWKQRFSPEFLSTSYKGSGGWKQAIIGEGDRPGVKRYSCTQLEIVVQNTYLRGMPQMYHSCGGKDRQYQSLEIHSADNPSIIWVQNAVLCAYREYQFPPCIGYRANQWMNFQVHIKIGTWYKNDRNYRRDSTIQFWVGENDKPSKLVIDLNPQKGNGFDIANTDPEAKYGKLWLLPYQTGKDPSQTHPTGYIWYDDLIVSRNKIPDPK